MKKREIPMRTQTLRKLTLICVVALSVLFSANSVLAQEQSCDIDGVKVGFQGTVCGIGAFFVELNGVRANGVNTKCLSIVGGNFTFTSTNKAFARLKPNQTYVVTSGTGICVNHINFDVPRGYKLFIDGIETTTISKTTGGASFTGDGSWNVVLRKDCDWADEEEGKAGNDVNSVIWQAGLGRLTDGRSAESISIREKTLSASTLEDDNSPQLYTTNSIGGYAWVPLNKLRALYGSSVNMNILKSWASMSYEYLPGGNRNIQINYGLKGLPATSITKTITY